MLTQLEQETLKRRQTISSLRALATWLEKNPEITLPYNVAEHLYIFCYSDLEKFNRIRRAGKFSQKKVDDYDFSLVKNFEAFTVELSVDRGQVCEKVQVGTKVVPAKEARVIEAQPERVEPVYKWKCPDSFLEKLNTDNGEETQS
jgi:hypothetical protein